MLILVGYTILLVLTVKRFKLGSSGFEGGLERLIREKEASPAAAQTVEEVKEEIAEFSQELGQLDVVLMRLSTEIETTLRQIADMSGLKRTKVGIGALFNMLRKKEILVDSWLL